MSKEIIIFVYTLVSNRQKSLTDHAESLRSPNK